KGQKTGRTYDRTVLIWEMQEEKILPSGPFHICDFGHLEEQTRKL
ncbi:hypothetical protein FB593_11836, partial [Rhizobium sp. SJZ105]